MADKEIKAETYDNVLVETDYTLFPKYESSIIDLKEDNYFEEAPAYSEGLKDIKNLIENGESEELISNDELFAYRGKLHPAFSSATVTMTFLSITNKGEHETVTFLVENSTQPDSEKSLVQLEDINEELAAINAEEEAVVEAQRIAREAEYEKEKTEQEQADKEREDNRYVKISEGNGVHKWEVIIESGLSLIHI